MVQLVPRVLMGTWYTVAPTRCVYTLSIDAPMLMRLVNRFLFRREFFYLIFSELEISIHEQNLVFYRSLRSFKKDMQTVS